MKSILEALEINAERLKDKIIFADKDNSVTYGEFVKKAKTVAVNILKKGAVNNKPIAVFNNRNIETLVYMFATLYSGNFYVVIDSDAPIDRLQKIYDKLNPVLTIYEKENERAKEIVSESIKVLGEDLSVGEISQDVLQSVKEKQISTDPAYALFTSGSTGMPKGAILSHQNILSYIQWFVKEFGISENTVFANQTPFYFSMSVSDIFATVYSGATFHIVPKIFFSFPVQLIDFLNERKVNTIYWVPSVLCLIANFKLFDYKKPQYLKTVLFAGEVMPVKQLNYWIKSLNGVKFVNLFGPTETTDICTFYTVNRAFDNTESLPIGKHCDNCNTFIVDEKGQEITEENVVGELYVRGPFLAYGYFNDEEKTDSVFVQNPLNPYYPEKVYKTGDLVKINSYGEYEYVGRKDFQIKHMGYRIELGEIETNAGAIEGAYTVVCVYDKEKDYIVLIYSGKIKEGEFGEIIKTKVPQYMIPNVIIRTPQLPMNQNGKIDRAWLKDNYETLIKK